MVIGVKKPGFPSGVRHVRASLFLAPIKEDRDENKNPFSYVEGAKDTY